MPTPEEIADVFKTSVDEFLQNDSATQGWMMLRERMTAWFTALDESRRFQAAMMVMKSHVYQHQLLMGDVLRESKTPLLIGAHDFIRQLAPAINASAGTIGKYLREQAGREAAMDACQAVLAQSTAARTRQGVATFRYFLSADSHEVRKRE
jgi:hypothetical protein